MAVQVKYDQISLIIILPQASDDSSTSIHTEAKFWCMVVVSTVTSIAIMLYID